MRVAATLLLLATLCVGVQSNGEYDVGSEVVLYANKVRPCAQARRHRSPAGSPSPGARVAQVGPFANPNEVYAFYSLPYCAPTEIETKRENLGALLKGDRPTHTQYEIIFQQGVAWKLLCEKKLQPPVPCMYTSYSPLHRGPLKGLYRQMRDQKKKF